MLRNACNVYVIIMTTMLVIESRIVNGAAELKPTTTDDSRADEHSHLDRVEEYFIEHKVSKTEAAKSFQQKSNDLLNKNPPRWCSPCSTEILYYCLSNRMLQDHCCCESRHGTEQLSWLPHSCYVGENCQTHTGSCIKYIELRECCCDRAMAKQWRDIYSSSSKLKLNYLLVYLVGLYCTIKLFNSKDAITKR